MGLLTREERQTLDRTDRRALRRERRQRRKDARPSGDGVKVNLARLRRQATVLILDYGPEARTEQGIDEILDELVDYTDMILIWSWVGPAGLLLEMADGPAIAALVRALVRPHLMRVIKELNP